MKMLFVSNYYPPYHLGGYDLLCHEVATRLESRGHQVAVLTSIFGASDDLVEDSVFRKLATESDPNYYHPQQLLHYRRDTQTNRLATSQVYREADPDVVVVWGMWNLSHLVPAWIEELAGPRVVYYLADAWPTLASAHRLYWQGTAETLRGRLFKRLMRGPVRLLTNADWEPPSLRFERTLVCSQTLKDQIIEQGVAIHDARVLYHGIDPVPYREAWRREHDDPPPGALRVAFVGTLAHHKGAHTIIEAIALLKKEDPSPHVTLSVLGAGHPDYEARLRRMVREGDLGDRVTFHRPIPRADLPQFLARHDSLVLSSIYEEPLARISQEAMATGLALVATLTGGTKEILVDQVNGLAFAPGDAASLATQLHRLANDGALRERLRTEAWQTVSERFTVTRMIDELEAYIGMVAERPRWPAN